VCSISRRATTKDINICICGFSAKYAALRRNIKDWFARNQSEKCIRLERAPGKPKAGLWGDNVFKCDIPFRTADSLFKHLSTIQDQVGVLNTQPQEIFEDTKVVVSTRNS
jgi:hypothetical protein